MIFEFNSEKSNANKEKHGIDFEEAQELWKDEKLLRIQTAHEKEERFLSIGKIQGKYWTAITTYRETKTRIISVRRSRKNEMLAYETIGKE